MIGRLIVRSIYQTMNTDILHSAIDRIIPPDDFPGAWDAGAGDYILRQLDGELRHLALTISEGLASLDREAQSFFDRPFASLTLSEQDHILKQVEDGEVRTVWITPPDEFFILLVRLTNEGYYGDMSNGGNRDEVSWRMIGYQTRIPVGRAL